MDTDEIERLEEILQEVTDLMHEAKGLFRGSSEELRFKSYPYGNIMAALGNCNYPYSSTSFRTCIDHLNDLRLSTTRRE